MKILWYYAKFYSILFSSKLWSVNIFFIYFFSTFVTKHKALSLTLVIDKHNHRKISYAYFIYLYIYMHKYRVCERLSWKEKFFYEYDLWCTAIIVQLELKILCFYSKWRQKQRQFHFSEWHKIFTDGERCCNVMTLTNWHYTLFQITEMHTQGNQQNSGILEYSRQTVCILIGRGIFIFYRSKIAKETNSWGPVEVWRFLRCVEAVTDI